MFVFLDLGSHDSTYKKGWSEMNDDTVAGQWGGEELHDLFHNLKFISDHRRQDNVY